jgi:hypothetical protein
MQGELHDGEPKDAANADFGVHLAYPLRLGSPSATSPFDVCLPPTADVDASGRKKSALCARSGHICIFEVEHCSLWLQLHQHLVDIVRKHAVVVSRFVAHLQHGANVLNG